MKEGYDYDEDRSYQIKLLLDEPQAQLLLGMVTDTKDYYLGRAHDLQRDGLEDSDEYDTLIWLYGEAKAMEMQIMSIYDMLGIKPVGLEEI